MKIKVPQIFLAVNSPKLGLLLEKDILKPAGFQVTSWVGKKFDPFVIQNEVFDVIVLESSAELGESLTLVKDLRSYDPFLSIILLSMNDDKDTILNSLRSGISDFLALPIKPDDLINSIQMCLKQKQLIEKSKKNYSSQYITSLNQSIEDMKELEGIGLTLTSSLDIDQLLTTIVETAVRVSGAEEGSLLILDEESGELFMRAAKNFQDEFVKTFRLPVNDTLAGEVIKTGTHVVVNQETPQKIKTTYLIRALMYVPLQVKEKVIGVLGVDNREKIDGFTDHHLSLLTTLADYAAVAIENANLYRSTENERQKLNQILCQVEDGVIVLDENKKIILINPIAVMMLGLETKDCLGKPVDEVVLCDDLLSLFNQDFADKAKKTEIGLRDGIVVNTQITQLPEIGYVITLQDITYFKELDRIKSEFVNTVSHDLRSPLTAIVGYVDLITKVGEVNERQAEFIHRIRESAESISDMISTLLELGRIEAGVEREKKHVDLGEVVRRAVDTFKNQMEEKHQILSMDLPTHLPKVFGNPIHFRQIAENLISNSVRYTPDGGSISIRLFTQGDLITFQVADTGLGIPLTEQEFIYEKFYRGSNIPDNVKGSGLGLAIVRTIVKNYQGRIWVDSKPGGGSNFTIELPLTES
jgi:two-component system phosphate regulon sensor histidine kinase PhoR